MNPNVVRDCLITLRKLIAAHCFPIVPVQDSHACGPFCRNWVDVKLIYK